MINALKLNVIHKTISTSLFNRNIRINSYSDEVKKGQQVNKNEVETPTIFDKILNRQLRADIIFEDEKCLAFNDVSPQAPVHFLVIPKTRISKLDKATKSDKEVSCLYKLT